MSSKLVEAAPAGPARLRRMRWWDIDVVAALDRAVFAEDAWSPAMFWSELADPLTCHYVVLVEDVPAVDAVGGAAERIIGYAGLAVVAREGEVRTIGVLGPWQGHGHGARLLTALLEEAAARRCTEVFLEVRVDNAPARHLYERFGFRAVGVRRGYYQPANVDALVMRLRHPGRPRRAPDVVGIAMDKEDGPSG